MCPLNRKPNMIHCSISTNSPPSAGLSSVIFRDCLLFDSLLELKSKSSVKVYSVSCLPRYFPKTIRKDLSNHYEVKLKAPYWHNGYELPEISDQKQIEVTNGRNHIHAFI